MGDLVLLQPQCTNLGSDWTCSTVCTQRFSLCYIWGPSVDMPNSISGFTGPRLRESYDEGRGTWVVYRLGALFGSVGHKVKIHKINPATGKERGDIEIKDYVVLQKPQGQDNRLPPPRTLIMDFTMTHVRFGRSHLHPIGQLTHTRRSDGAPDPDGALKEAARIKIRH